MKRGLLIPTLLGLTVITSAFLAFIKFKTTEFTLSLSFEWFVIFLIVNVFISACIVYVIMRNQINRIKRLSNTDELTGLYSSREISRLLSYDVERSRRYRSDLSLVLLDIDHFSDLNAEHGSKNADGILMQISHLLLNGIKYINKEEKEFHGIRSSDIAFRYENQDRILLILPETNIKGAYIAADRLREAVMYTEFKSVKGSKKIRTSISIAVVGFNGQDDTVESLLLRADLLLLKAKITRNSVVMENPLNKEASTPYDIDAVNAIETPAV